MVTYNFPNGTTPDEVLVGVSGAIPGFPILILVFSWFFVFLSGAISQNKRQGYTDMAQWSVMASLSTLLLSLIMTINAGMIPLEILIVTISLTIDTCIPKFRDCSKIKA